LVVLLLGRVLGLDGCSFVFLVCVFLSILKEEWLETEEELFSSGLEFNQSTTVSYFLLALGAKADSEGRGRETYIELHEKEGCMHYRSGQKAKREFCT